MKQFVFIIGLMIALKMLYSQELDRDTAYTLPIIQVSASRLEQFSPGQKVIVIDSLSMLINKYSNLGEILSKNTFIQFKTYNYNGLNLISFRGTSTHHTGVYWNGFQINPASTSQVDFSLIPSFLFNDISILYGGSSTLLGSGNIGGSILLNNKPNFNASESGNVGLAMGSFGEYNASGTFKVSDDKWYSKTSLVYSTAKNDFTYKNLNGEKSNQKNAAFEQVGLMQDLFRNFGKDAVVGLSYWYQENKRDIPATMTSKSSDAFQEDKSLRAAVSYKYYFDRGQLNIKSAYLDDYLHYNDPDTVPGYTIDSEISSQKSISEVDFECLVLDGFVINLGSNFTYEEASSDNYLSNAIQRQYSVFASWLQMLPLPGWKMNMNLRQDYYSDVNSPFLFALSFEGKIWKWFSGKINVSKNFRIPTFHDRYWEPGGNPGLKPEDSDSQEATLIAEGGKKLGLKFLFTGYSSEVNNWILWVPDGLYWSPQNVQKVWSRGLEINGNMNFQVLKIRSNISSGYTFTRSTNEMKQGPNDNSFQKQLLYVPEHNYFFNFSLSFKEFVLNYNQTYTGLRYTTPDNIEYLPAYTLGNLTFRKVLNMTGHKLGLQFDINNIWNEDYQAVLYYPMPGRHYKFSVNFLINQYQ